MNGTEIVTTRKSRGQVDLEIKGLYRAEAQNIVKNLRRVSMCVVSGQFGIGKSTSLVPSISEETIKSRLGVVSYEYHSSSRDLEFVSELRRAGTGVLIFDEAGGLSHDGEVSVRKFIETAHLRGYKVLPIIAYPVDRPDLRDGSIRIWSKEEKRISGEVPPVVDLAPKVIAKQLAQDYLLTREAVTPWKSEVLDYVLSLLPLLPRVLWQLSDITGNDLQKARLEISTKIGHLHGIVQDRTLEEVKNRVMAEYLRGSKG